MAQKAVLVSDINKARSVAKAALQSYHFTGAQPTITAFSNGDGHIQVVVRCKSTSSEGATTPYVLVEELVQDICGALVIDGFTVELANWPSGHSDLTWVIEAWI